RGLPAVPPSLRGRPFTCGRGFPRPGSRDVASAGTRAADPGSPRSQGPERIDLERAIRELPDGYREVFILHDVEGLTHQEIGGQLGIDAGTSKSQLSRARRALRAYWAGGKPRTAGWGASQMSTESDHQPEEG